MKGVGTGEFPKREGRMNLFETSVRAPKKNHTIEKRNVWERKLESVQKKEIKNSTYELEQWYFLGRGSGGRIFFFEPCIFHRLIRLI